MKMTIALYLTVSWRMDFDESDFEGFVSSTVICPTMCSPFGWGS